MSNYEEEVLKKYLYLNFFYLVILGALIYSFHTELFIASIRLYSSLINHPRIERILGDYYTVNGYHSSALAYNFYLDARKKYTAQLLNARPDEQVIIRLVLEGYIDAEKAYHKI